MWECGAKAGGGDLVRTRRWIYAGKSRSIAGAAAIRLAISDEAETPVLGRMGRARIVVGVLTVCAIGVAVYLLYSARDDLPGWGESMAVGAAICLFFILLLASTRPGSYHSRRERLEAQDESRFLHIGEELPFVLHRLLDRRYVNRRVELLAFYPDAVVLKQVPASESLPYEVLTPDGAQSLADLGDTEAGRIIPMDSVEVIEVRDARSGFHRAQLSVHFAGSEPSIEFEGSVEAVNACEYELSELVGDRVRHVCWTAQELRNTRVKQAVAWCLVMDVLLGILLLTPVGDGFMVTERIRGEVGIGVLVMIFVYFAVFVNAVAFFIAWRGVGKGTKGDA